MLVSYRVQRATRRRRLRQWVASEWRGSTMPSCDRGGDHTEGGRGERERGRANAEQIPTEIQ